MENNFHQGWIFFLLVFFFFSFSLWHKEIQALKKDFVFSWPKFKAGCDLVGLFLMVFDQKMTSYLLH